MMDVPSTTWLFVSTRPLLVRIMPVPSSVPLWKEGREITSTIPGPTFLVTACVTELFAFVLPPPDPAPLLGWGTAPPPGSEMLGDELPELWLSASTVPAPTP